MIQKALSFLWEAALRLLERRWEEAEAALPPVPAESRKENKSESGWEMPEKDRERFDEMLSEYSDGIDDELSSWLVLDARG